MEFVAKANEEKSPTAKSQTPKQEQAFTEGASVRAARQCLMRFRTLLA